MDFDLHRLLNTHPNDPHADSLPLSWSDNNDWLSIASHDGDNNPPTKYNDRDPISLPTFILDDKRGMSPKKAHEVSRMISYLDQAFSPGSIKHVVDVGAGQGYLSRTIHSHFCARVLALDSSDVQTNGAQRWHSTEDDIVHRTIYVTPESLIGAVDDWIEGLSTSGAIPVDEEKVPVLVAALHACGSLTPSIVRAFFESRRKQRRWFFSSMVVVGCCYNLLDPSDFPLSAQRRTSSYCPRLGLDLNALPTSAFQLATQTPHRWNDTEDSRRKALLAIKKVVWRALWGRILRNTDLEQQVKEEGHNVRAGLGQLPWSCKLGKLKDTSYFSWETFLEDASKRTGLLPPSVTTPLASEIDDPEQRKKLENQLATLHIKRCYAGRIVEDVILEDRKLWIQELLDQMPQQPEDDVGSQQQLRVEMVNIFDQKMGSARNVAIVVR